ncbi:MAG: cytochrome c3 family protein, partial [Pseudomonadota bacterium]
MGLAFACLIIACCALFLVFPIAFSAYANHPEKPITIKLEEAKLPPVIFPHTTHVEKNKIECAVCHHKDAKEPEACIK